MARIGDEMPELMTATWSLSLDCDCPGCGEYVDLLLYPDFWDGRHFQPCEYATARTEGVEVVCPNCHHEFSVNFEY